jgi:hypothetical protein
MMPRITLVPPPGAALPEAPATIAQLISAIDGLRYHLDDFHLTTASNLTLWRDELQVRLERSKQHP